MALLGELRRRNIFKVSLAYMILSWLIIQIANLLLPTFGAPGPVMQYLVLFLILAFPIAVLLAWAFELTPEGLKPTADVDKTQSITVKTGRRLNRIVAALIGISITFLAIDYYVFPDQILPGANVDYRKSLAVLPIQIDSQAGNTAHVFSGGMHDELLTRLSGVTDLRVISRTSLMKYQVTLKDAGQIGEELGVGSVLIGTMLEAEDSFELALQLTDTRTNELLWSDTFEQELSAESSFTMPAEVAAAVADELDASLSDSEEERLSAIPTQSLATIETYFSGRQAFYGNEPDAIETAIEHFNRAVVIDPQFAPAWTGLAEALLESPNVRAATNPRYVRMETAAAVNRAIALDPGSASATAALGWHRLVHNYDWKRAEESFRNALALDDSNVNALLWYSNLLSWQGRHGEAISNARNAITADPLSIAAQTNLRDILVNARRWQDAFDLNEKLLASDTAPRGRTNLWIDKFKAGQITEAVAELETWAQNSGRSESSATELGRSLLNQAQTVDEDVPFPAELVAELNFGTEVSEVYALFADGEKTLTSLESSYRDRIGDPSLLSIRINPLYDFVREDPRFVALMTHLGLAE